MNKLKMFPNLVVCTWPNFDKIEVYCTTHSEKFGIKQSLVWWVSEGEAKQKQWVPTEWLTNLKED